MPCLLCVFMWTWVLWGDVQGGRERLCLNYMYVREYVTVSLGFMAAC